MPTEQKRQTTTAVTKEKPISLNQKHFIVAKDVLRHDPLSFKKFTGNHVYILSSVLKELRLITESQRKNDIAVFQSREVLNKIKETINGNVKDATSPNGLYLSDCDVTLHIVKSEERSKNENYYIDYAKDLMETKSKLTFQDVIVISKSIDVRIECELENINSQDYQNDKILGEEIASLFQKVSLPDEKFAELMQDISSFNVHELGVPLYPNCFVEITCKSDAYTPYYLRYNGKNLVNISSHFEPFAGISPINLEQRFFFELLRDDNTDIITVSGSGGSGKTLISVAAALQMVLKEHKYSKIIYVKPTIPTDDGQGFIKGDLYDKLRPYMTSFFDALTVIFSKDEKNNRIYKKYTDQNDETEIDVEKFARKLIDKQKLELTCFSYMRGRNIRDSIVIVDEGQQTTPFIAKLMLSRLSENAKILFIGDPSDNQIDNFSVDPRSNGLVHIAAKLRNCTHAGHVSLKSVERGRIADIADKFL